MALRDPALYLSGTLREIYPGKPAQDLGNDKAGVSVGAFSKKERGSVQRTDRFIPRNDSLCFPVHQLRYLSLEAFDEGIDGHGA
ncbi:hypothetical protein GCM10022408_19720 [Hymenobacter fastidiosus]|uniref:Uncharacterized protein n=1 Tax=Hymenobacter fastidiosus TaxID=486264 RepID=A0ABP7S7M7_9BACT